MGWNDAIDGYCERLDTSFWAEPLNAITNAAFIIAALIMWRRSRDFGSARLLCALLFAIGVGSFLFHTFATPWAALADVTPIGAFILSYLYLVNRWAVGWPVWASALGTLAFLPYAGAVTFGLRAVPFFQISNFYWTVPLLLLIYASRLRQRLPQFTRGMVLGAGVLSLSIALRSVDEAWCAHIPVGTHIWWHLLNGLMLGWMIEIYLRHRSVG